MLTLNVEYPVGTVEEIKVKTSGQNTVNCKTIHSKLVGYMTRQVLPEKKTTTQRRS